MWNIAHNLGGFAAPILAGTAARSLGWNVSLHATTLKCTDFNSGDYGHLVLLLLSSGLSS
jgi:hypothetical protein